MKPIKRQTDNNPFAHIRHKSNDDWYLYWVCEDLDFKKRMAEYRSAYTVSELPNSLTVEQAEKLMGETIKEYGITDFEFGVIQTGLHSQGAFDYPFRHVDSEDDSLVLKIPRNITKEDYIAAWDELVYILRPVEYEDPFADERVVIKEKSKRRRPPDDTKLVYAVHRARIKGLTFREIFENYQNGTLACYENMPTNNYSSEDSLERYYNKYKPDR